MPIIYLAGPMDHVSTEHQSQWRDKVIQRMRNWEFKILDPRRRPHDCNLSYKEIVNLDLQDIRKCDVVLVDNRPAKTYGTPCEIFYASYILKKPVIGWYEDEKPSGIFQEVLIDAQFPSLNEAIQHIVEHYNGEL